MRKSAGEERVLTVQLEWSRQPPPQQPQPQTQPTKLLPRSRTHLTAPSGRPSICSTPQAPLPSPLPLALAALTLPSAPAVPAAGGGQAQAPVPSQKMAGAPKV